MEASSTLAFMRREHCPICCSSEVCVLFESGFGEGPVGDFMRRYYGCDVSTLPDGRYELMRCLNCSLVYQGWVGNFHLLDELYSVWINDGSHPEQDEQYKAFMRHPLEYRDAHEILTLAAFLDRPVNGLVTLDFGMGWAMWARVAQLLGCDSYGAELSRSRVQYARAHGIEVLRPDDLPSERFDFVNTEQVMEHIPDVRNTAERLVRSLKPGGILKVSVPSGERVDRIVGKLQQGRGLTNAEFVPIQPLEHVNSFTARSLSALAAQLGLRQVRPKIAERYSFLTAAGTLSFQRSKNAVKELARPFYTFNSRRNLYVWLQRPS